MLHVVTTGAYYPPVVTTWQILTTAASQLTAGSLCIGDVFKDNADNEANADYYDDGGPKDDAV